MPLINFGSILNFAEELETSDHAFYTSAAENPLCADYKEIFEQFAADGKKNKQTILRARRENVTEMILEPIRDFTRSPFHVVCGNSDTMSAEDVLDTARKLEERAERYYTEAALKIKALSEVSRILKTIAKKRAVHRKRLRDA
ncbi:ferritin-like domain-containing protein [Desulfococcaceae bacterium HSG8]|nr:ferritin-like domain-containing protein [Desulfococcaceae bacterium HSG8]